MGYKWQNEREKLQKLIIEDNISYEEIGRMYGCSGNNIKKQAKKLGILLPNRRKINDCETFNKQEHRCLYCNELLNTRRKYCNNICQSKYEEKLYIKEWKLGLQSGHDVRYKISPYIRRYLLTKNNYSCELCGCNLKNPYSGLSILQIHHIDGDASNTEENNLQVLCPNCHAMTDNFGSMNTSSTREYRKEDYSKIENNIKTSLA